jgi:hypothetical protein
MQVSERGFWLYLLADQREYYLSFEHFPWFADATVRQLSLVEIEHGHILRWPELDVDLDLARIEHPEHYPLIAARRTKPLRVSEANRGARQKAVDGKASGRRERG